MAALGELLIVIIYGILAIPIIISLDKILRNRKSKTKWIIVLSISTILLSLFSYSQYSIHKSAELNKVGIYQLTNYPNCTDCIIELKSDNTFEIRNEIKIHDIGNWYYSSGGDYWITHIGEYGQLGSDIYQYR